jgi:hypothetical protein
MKLFVQLAALVYLLSLGCAPQTPPAKTPKSFKPTLMTMDDVATHEFYRDVTFTEFSPSLKSGSLDMLDFAVPEGERYVIVLVTAVRPPDKLTSYTTTFTTSDGSTIIKKWQTASGNSGSQAQAVFMLPTTVNMASSTSEVSENQTAP